MSENLPPWQKYKENLGETRPWVDEEKAKERFSICKGCPELIKLTTQCKKCGCFMKVKTKLEKAECPLGKW